MEINLKNIVYIIKNMEKYIEIANEPERWGGVFINEVDVLPFTRATRLGRGENCAVYSLHPSRCEYDEVSELSDESDSDSCSGCDSEDEDCKEEDEPYFSEDSDDDMNGDPPERVVMVSPFGQTQVISKVFQRLDEEVTFIIRNTSTGKIERVLPTIDEAEYVIERSFRNKKNIEIEEVQTLFTQTTLGFPEFQLESLIHTFISRMNISPHVIHCYNSLQFNNTGYLLLERIHTTFEELVNVPELEKECFDGRDLTTEHIGVMLFQTLVILDTLQRACNFKHHDLHIGNIFIKIIDDTTMFRNQLLKNATHFHYRIDGQDYYTPNIGVIPKMSDFAMSSLDIHGRRMGRTDIQTFNDAPDIWGVWSNQYDGERGYDAQVLFGDVPFDNKSRHKKCQRLRGLMKKLRANAFGKGSKVSKKKGRPLPGHISNKPAEMIIRSVFKDDPEEWYNYKTIPPEGSVIVTLGNTEWL